MSETAQILASRQCLPCKSGAQPLLGPHLRDLSAQLGHGWTVEGEHHLEKTFSFPDFISALDFTNKVGAVAETQSHHPDIYLAWGKVQINIWTHKINGLTESDFILAAKIEFIQDR